MLTMLLLVLLAQADPYEREPLLKCTSIGGPVQIGPTGATVPMKCCPHGMFVADPNHPALDAKGELICSRDL